MCASAALLSLVACAAGAGAPPATSVSTVATAGDDAAPLPPPADEYLTAARPGGVLGGSDAAELASAVADALRRRGDHAEADSALATAATWLGRQALDHRGVQALGAEAAARRFGFAGVLLAAVTFPLDASGSEAWQQALASIAANMPVSRYGISVSPSARYAALVLGDVGVTLAPFPRRVSPGGTLTLRGEVMRRFEMAHVYLTGADGQVQQTPMRARRIDAVLSFPKPGVYKVEVIGDGATGPVVLANVPVYVGVPEPELPQAATTATAGTTTAALSAGDAEARMLALLNQARAQAGLTSLQPDAELRALALAHSEDMIRGRFFGHVSPSTGTLDDRVRRAGLPLVVAGENIAQTDGAEAAHQFLMESPGHRANMLGAKFTHVGIGGVVLPGEQTQLMVTLVFGRRATLPAAPLTAADVTNAIAELRRRRGVTPAGIDPLLQAAASTGIAALPAGPSPDPQPAFAAANAALSREVQRQRVSRGAGCAQVIELLELDQLTQHPIFVDPALRRIGAAVTTRTDGKVTRLVLFVMTEGATCG